MSSLQVYERGAIFADQQLMIEVQNFEVDSDAKNNPIDTMQKGFAGISPGSEHTKINVTSAIPRAGYDYDALKKMQGRDIVEFVVFAAGGKESSKGFIMNVKKSFGADKAAAVSFEFMGGPLETSTL
jgi:hypothetical protein